MLSPDHENGGAELYFRECIDELSELPEYVLELNELGHVNQKKMDKIVDTYGDKPDLMFDKLCMLAIRSHLVELQYGSRGPSLLEPITTSPVRNIETLLEEATIKIAFNIGFAFAAMKKWYVGKFEGDNSPPRPRPFGQSSL